MWKRGKGEGISMHSLFCDTTKQIGLCAWAKKSKEKVAMKMASTMKSELLPLATYIQMQRKIHFTKQRKLVLHPPSSLLLSALLSPLSSLVCLLVHLQVNVYTVKPNNQISRGHKTQMTQRHRNITLALATYSQWARREREKRKGIKNIRQTKESDFETLLWTGERWKREKRKLLFSVLCSKETPLQ